MKNLNLVGEEEKRKEESKSADKDQDKELNSADLPAVGLKDGGGKGQALFKKMAQNNAE